jgi:hypothetical protein
VKSPMADDIRLNMFERGTPRCRVEAPELHV